MTIRVSQRRRTPRSSPSSKDWSTIGCTFKVAFGTEGGLFASRLDVPTVVCGPGSMDQGHKADEYVSLASLDACDRMLGRLLDRIAA